MIARVLSSQTSAARRLAGHYSRFARYLGFRRVLVLQLLALCVGILTTLGLATLFPALQILVTSPDDFLGKHVSRWISQDALPQWMTNQPLRAVLIALVTLQLLKFLLSTLYAGVGNRWLESYSSHLRMTILRTYFAELGTRSTKTLRSELIHLNNQLLQFSSYNWGLIDFVFRIYQLVWISVFVIALSHSVIGVLLGLALCSSLVLIPAWAVSRRLAARFYSTQRDILQEFVISVEGGETFKTSRAEPARVSTIHQVGQRYVKIATHLGISRQIVFSMPELLLFSTIALILSLLTISPSEIAFYATLGYGLIRFTSAFNDVSSRYQLLIENEKSPEEIYQYVHRSTPPKGSAPLGELRSIEFKATMVRTEEAVLLCEFSGKIKVGAITQVIGANGAGKSTLVRSLAGLQKYSGSILLNGTELREIYPEDLYSRIAYLGQDAFVFPGSILENVLIGNPNKSEQDAQILVDSLGLNLSSKFPDGLRHRIDADMKNLSGGERQIICLLRTLLRDADLYILDEFSNHLSDEVYRRVLGHILKMHGKTRLVVSHQDALPESERIELLKEYTPKDVP
jgi:ATP-binding cassette subfamily B protein